jgi:hypothetical protein
MASASAAALAFTILGVSSRPKNPTASLMRFLIVDSESPVWCVNSRFHRPHSPSPSLVLMV